MAKEANIVFPDYLTDDAYKFRKFTINIIKAPSLGEGVENALEKIKNKAKISFGSKSADSVKDMNKNLENNYAKLYPGVTEYVITLPLPNTFSDTQNHDWNHESGVLGTMTQTLQNKSLSDIVGSVLGKKSGKLGKFGEYSKKFSDATGLGNITASKSMGAMADATGLRKPLADPGYFQNYSGSEPRTFSFTFDLVPANAVEAAKIIKIIMKLKEYSSPEMALGGISLLAPNYFDLEIANEYLSGAANIKNVVLSSINVNYGADGAMQFAADGTPKYISMSLTFKERSMVTANHYRS